MVNRLHSELEYGKLLKEAKRLAPPGGWIRFRVAILGDCALQPISPLLQALFGRAEVAVEVYEAGYDTADQEVYDPASGLYAFQPQVVVLLDSVQHLRDKFFGSELARASFVTRVADRLEGRWSAIASRCSAVIVQSNFALPFERVFGNFDHRVATSFTSVVHAINTAISERIREHKAVFVNDVEYVSAYVGLRSWYDEKLWLLSKSLCAFEYLPLVARNVVDIALAARGVGIKCVVLDLDNTVWGGVIGDDGLDGIRVGHLGDGEAFATFQRFMLELSQRGILLAVCSKNERENALAPFREHAEMVLREKDIVMFMANWDDKAKNIAIIKEALNIGYDAMVFLDDNPFERNLVRELLPDVVVPELPEDPADYVKAVCALNLFETSTFSDLDRQRAELYRGEAKRAETKQAFATVDEYLESLSMEIDVRRFAPAALSRIAQLIQRSNQFNLSTRRYSEAQCAELMEDPSSYPISVNLRDRFGDYGLISVIVVRMTGSAALIDEYLMSCRVLQRGVEQFVMNHLFEVARARGLSRVEGTYIPSKKNAMVAAFYERFGFVKMETDAEGATRWGLAVEEYRPALTPQFGSAGDRGAAAVYYPP